ncbi:MAG: O-antigen ligase family protein [Candidatus Atribacteria bacterium]|nr:O-antigen ligase family protein [Candidatus Atribacteria bacterium]
MIPFLPARFGELVPRWIILGVILLSPYYRGLYPDFYKIPFVSLIFLASLIYGAYTIKRKTNVLQFRIEHLLFLLLVVVYGCSLFFPASKGSAFGIFLCYGAWFFLFILVGMLFQELFQKVFLVQVVVVNAAVLSLIGFFGALKFIPDFVQHLFGMSFWGLYFYQRVASTFQYQNTAASFYVSCFFLGLFVLIQQKKFGKKIIFFILNFIIFAGFLFAFSRGGNLAFLISVGFLFFILKNEEWRIESAFSLIALVTPLIFLQSTLDHCLIQSLSARFWVFFGLALTFSLLLFSFFHRIFSGAFTLRISRSRLLIFLIIIVACELIFLFFLQIDTERGIMTREFEGKDLEISLQTKNVSDRLFFYRDALKMSRQRPLLGWGGGGWAAHYFAFQSFTYYTKFSHSLYFDTLVEVGFSGLLFLLLLLFFSFRSFWKFIQNHHPSDSVTLLMTFLGVAVGNIFIHSAVDLNFSMGAYHILAWTLLALLVSSFGNPRLSWRVPFLPLFIASVVLLVISISLGNAEYYFQTGNWMRDENNIPKTAWYWERTISLNPFHDRAWYQLSVLANTLYQQNGKREFYDLAREKIEKALLLEPWSYEYYRQRGDLFLENRELDRAFEEYFHSIQLAPLVTGNYERILLSILMTMDREKQAGSANTVKMFYNYAEKVYSLFTENQKRSIRPVTETQILDQLRKDIRIVSGGE